MVSQDQWSKTKTNLQWIQDQLTRTHKKQIGKLLCKTLESIRGFLVYVSRIYPAMVPYLKGIHLTLDLEAGLIEVRMEN